MRGFTHIVTPLYLTPLPHPSTSPLSTYLTVTLPQAHERKMRGEKPIRTLEKKEGEEGGDDKVSTWVGKFTPRLLTTPMALETPNGSHRLQTHAVCWLPMTPTDFHLLRPRELTPQPHAQGQEEGGR